ncbi:Multidrug export protein EmrB [compost metagenome]
MRLASVLALLGLGYWIIRMLFQPQPYINLRLYGRRNFGFSSVVGAAAGMGLYGSTFILPLFLAQIAGYNPMQIGEVIMWMGLPQIFMMPVAAKLSKQFDNRAVCSLGLVLFAISCFLNSGMDANTSRDQLIYSQVFRALGQPLIVLTLSNFATYRMEQVNLPSASSLFNMSRILGGAVGTALLATVLTIREQYHSARLGEAVSVFAKASQGRLAQLADAYLAQGSTPLRASQQAVAAIADVVRREAYVAAYNDCFFLLAWILLGAIVALWVVDRVVPESGK